VEDKFSRHLETQPTQLQTRLSLDLIQSCKYRSYDSMETIELSLFLAQQNRSMKALPREDNILISQS
jgi:hypothetical protein